MSRVISFDMHLDKEPEKVRSWEYKAVSLKISPKAFAKGKRPTFIVVEKGINIGHLTVEQDATGVRFILTDNTEFTQTDAQRAVGLITEAMFRITSANGVINQVDSTPTTH